MPTNRPSRRRMAARLNAQPELRTAVGVLDIHVLHVLPRHRGSLRTIAPQGLPGYGFSGKPSATGWDPVRIARAWVVLMQRLGYTRYVAQGGD
ncbi:epoxide hydrolase, partial [Burkholderia sp. Tr-860]|nr:epoxide hydrolase [Burkholderia sp. Tr-860]